MKKCKFYKNEVKFLGKIVDRDGVRLDLGTTDAILKMPLPNDKAKLSGHRSLKFMLTKYTWLMPATQSKYLS